MVKIIEGAVCRMRFPRWETGIAGFDSLAEFARKVQLQTANL